MIADFYAQRFGLGEALRRLCEELGIRFFGSESGRVVAGDEEDEVADRARMVFALAFSANLAK